MKRPLLTAKEHRLLLAARDAGQASVALSLDLGLGAQVAEVAPDRWTYAGVSYPYLAKCKDRTIYLWSDDGYLPVARFGSSLIKLVPTAWGPPTFEIDGIKMLPTAQVCPYADAERKVGLIEPQGKVILDTCGGLGYFAAWCLKGGAKRVLSYEKNPDVLWLREVNPWSPAAEAPLELTHGDIATHMKGLPSGSVDAILHDPPRFGVAGELYSQVFYDQLARVIKRKGRMFHYTGSPNRLTSNRDVPGEVSKRLVHAGFSVRVAGDGLLALRN